MAASITLVLALVTLAGIGVISANIYVAGRTHDWRWLAVAAA